MKRGSHLIAAAFALTALSYGLARFAYGLFLPQIRSDLGLGVSAAGWIGGSAFAAYCLGIVLTFVSNGRLSPRTIVVSAGLAATIGMGLIVLASSARMLGCGVALAGLSTGLTSPPLASAVAARFNDKDRPRANGFINAGTAAGILFTGLAAVIAYGAWRELYSVFALIGACVTVWLWFAVPAQGAADVATRFSMKLLQRSGVLALCSSAFLMGLASTAIWTFGADLLRNEFGFTDINIAWAWIALGAAGISGCTTGLLTNRYGTRRMHGLALLGMAIGILSLAAATLSPIFGFTAMCVFGAAYIVSSGVYLIQGIDLFPDRPDLGLGIPFLVLALGQTAGTPLFAVMLETANVKTALFVFAAAACSAIFIRPSARAGNLAEPQSNQA
ncbi:hypothetical protein PS645_03715 [Pseudomonas fluorescens]|uniref:Major facilitator superfamily (MFS) profile domain-containing protein n=1 Tax=Pseudomonas fluorescens TaxID=294 RepID=A0A5E6UVH1_PSEFL|nr:MFS transporter [Pseudomonas fluorescens]VVN09500.1 hypothetical protein PS645_03715 [Pseudomonas fluorescens]